MIDPLRAQDRILPSPQDYLDIQSRLEEIESELPFEIVFYGSRERGDFEADSDFNFYLLASTQDQMKPGFIQKVNSALNALEKIATVNLIAGDMDTFRLRMNLAEPSVVHMLELGTVFFGNRIFHDYQKEWESKRKQPLPKEKLVPFLKRRIQFYQNLKARTQKEDAVRRERVTTLAIQVWVLERITDLTVEELVALDIPSRSDRMIPTLYAREWDSEIGGLLESRAQAREDKRSTQRVYNPVASRSSLHLTLSK